MTTSAAAYQKIKVTPIAGALGAEIEGADLSKPLPDAIFHEIKKAFLLGGGQRRLQAAYG